MGSHPTIPSELLGKYWPVLGYDADWRNPAPDRLCRRNDPLLHRIVPLPEGIHRHDPRCQSCTAQEGWSGEVYWIFHFVRFYVSVCANADPRIEKGNAAI